MGSWLRCDCGNLLHTNLFCGANLIKFVRDGDFDRLVEPFETEAVRELFLDGPTAYHCSECNRLYVDWESNGTLTTYLPDRQRPLP